MAIITKTVAVALGASRAGLVVAGTIRVGVYDASGTELIEPTITGIVERGTSGYYYVPIANWDTTWSGEVRWTLADGTFLIGEPFSSQNGEFILTETTTTELTATPQAIATSDCILQIRQGRTIRLCIKPTGTITTAEDAADDYMELDAEGTLKIPQSFVVGSGSTLYAWKSTEQSETVKLTAMS